MAETVESDAGAKSLETRSPSGLEFLNRLPWERIVTWACVFVVLYLLRDFFE